MKTRMFLVVVGVAAVVTSGAGFLILRSNGFSTRNTAMVRAHDDARCRQPGCVLT